MDSRSVIYCSRLGERDAPLVEQMDLCMTSEKTSKDVSFSSHSLQTYFNIDVVIYYQNTNPISVITSTQLNLKYKYIIKIGVKLNEMKKVI